MCESRKDVKKSPDPTKLQPLADLPFFLFRARV
jgi:hypothetical protein